MSLLNPTTFLNALKDYLEDLKQSDEVTPVFEDVALYDSTQMRDALRDLTLRTNRLCFVVPQEDSYNNRLEGRAIIADANYTVSLLIADKDYRGGQRATFGDADSPGVIGMKHAVLQGITGSNLGLDFVLMQPIEGDIVHVENKEIKQSRRAYLLTFQTPAGRIQTAVQRGIRT